jgi:hypothetical protein
MSHHYGDRLWATQRLADHCDGIGPSENCDRKLADCSSLTGHKGAYVHTLAQIVQVPKSVMSHALNQVQEYREKGKDGYNT